MQRVSSIVVWMCRWQAVGMYVLGSVCQQSTNRGAIYQIEGHETGLHAVTPSHNHSKHTHTHTRQGDATATRFIYGIPIAVPLDPKGSRSADHILRVLSGITSSYVTSIRFEFTTIQPFYALSLPRSLHHLSLCG